MNARHEVGCPYCPHCQRRAKQRARTARAPRPKSPELLIELFCPAVPEAGVDGWTESINIESPKDIATWRALERAYRGEL
jgi:hypothetical protein